MAYDSSCGLHDHWRDVPWEDIFKLSAFAAASEFCGLVIVAKGFLKLPNLNMLINQKSLSVPRNLTLWTFGRLHIVFSTFYTSSIQ